MVTSAAAAGFAITASLIVAIGAQNAFVLRQGLRREHVGAIVVFCIAVDAALISAGVAGVGTALSSSTLLLQLTAIGGCAFLIWYALRSFGRALRPETLRVGQTGSTASLRTVLGQLSACTFLNPHMYVDTVLLIGSVGAQQPATQRMWFSAGAVSASALWFVGLGFGARLLQPLFARQISWRILDALIGMTMLCIAYLLSRQLL